MKSAKITEQAHRKLKIKSAETGVNASDLASLSILHVAGLLDAKKITVKRLSETEDKICR